MNYETIKLLGGAEVVVDFDDKEARCRKCGKKIRFGITKHSRLMPIIQQEDGQWKSHFADCQFAAEFRKTDLERKVEDQAANEEQINNL